MPRKLCKGIGFEELRVVMIKSVLASGVLHRPATIVADNPTNRWVKLCNNLHDKELGFLQNYWQPSGFKMAHCIQTHLFKNFFPMPVKVRQESLSNSNERKSPPSYDLGLEIHKTHKGITKKEKLMGIEKKEKKRSL